MLLENIIYVHAGETLMDQVQFLVEHQIVQKLDDYNLSSSGS